MQTSVSAEEAQGQAFLRWSFRSFKGSARTGSTTKTFAWPVADADHPIEWSRLMERIVAAASPAAPRHDPRSALGRLFDRVCGMDQINHLPCLAEHRHSDRRTWLECTLYRTRDGIEVTLTHRVEGRSALWARMPMGTIEAMQRWAAGSRDAGAFTAS